MAAAVAAADNLLLAAAPRKVTVAATQMACSWDVEDNLVRLPLPRQSGDMCQRSRLQLLPRRPPPTSNRHPSRPPLQSKAEALVRGAAGAGANIILLQELFETPYFCQEQKQEYYRLARVRGCWGGSSPGCWRGEGVSVGQLGAGVRQRAVQRKAPTSCAPPPPRPPQPLEGNPVIERFAKLAAELGVVLPSAWRGWQLCAWLVWRRLPPSSRAASSPRPWPHRALALAPLLPSPALSSSRS